MTIKKNIILDFGGVIIDLDFSKTYTLFHKMGIESVSDEQLQIFKQFEAGLVSTETLYDSIRKDISIEASNDDITEAWSALLRELPQNRVDFLHKLGKQFPLYLLSNTNSIHIDYLRKRENSKFDKFESSFSKVFYSYEMQSRKPDSEIFQKVLDELIIKPEETLFVDDMPENIETANGLGFKTWLFDVEKDDITKILQQDFFNETII